MRGLLIVNPNATTTNERVRDVLIKALAHELECEAVVTTHPGHAGELARQAREDKLDAVVTLGGDGTINEAVNGLLAKGPGSDVPVLATVPGGSANVLARSIGLPRDPVEATGMIIEGLVDRRYRTINIGHALIDGDTPRYFTMSVGMGLDAEIIAAMEAQRGAGKKATPARYFTTTLRQYFSGTDRKEPNVVIRRRGVEDVDHVFLAIVLNAAPWTFFGGIPVNPLPHASFDLGLDYFAIRDLRVLPTLRWARRIMTASKAGSTKGLAIAHDVEELELIAKQPTAVQLDGEALGPHSRVRVTSVEQGLRIVV